MEKQNLLDNLTVQLQKHWFKHDITVNEQLLNSAEFVAETIVDKLKINVSYFAWAQVEEHVEYVNFRVPKTWWDMFKQKYMPTWYLVKYPVEYNIEQVKFKVRSSLLHTDFVKLTPNDQPVIKVAITQCY